MKKTIGIFFLVLLVSCSKDDDGITQIFLAGPMTYGWGTANKNDLAFESSGTAQGNNEIFGLYFDTFTSDGFWRERILLDDIKYEVGEYIIKGEIGDISDGFVGGWYYTLNGGDVLEDSYLLKDSPNNKLTISKIDTVENIVKGTFCLEFKIDPDREKRNQDNLNNVTFSEGEFEISFKE